VAARPLVDLATAPFPRVGPPVAWLIGAGFAVRALGQIAALDEPGVRQGLDTSAVLLYCLGFAYALRGSSPGRWPIWLHLGAAGLFAGVLLHGLIGKTPPGLALSAVGAVLLMATMGRAASRGEAGFARIALLVSATGPGLFALNTFAFPAAGDLLHARFLRLGATAAMALPLLAALYRVHHAHAATRAARLARILFGVGMVALPLVLLLSAFVDERLKYGLGPASDCFTVALIIACVQAWRGGNVAALAGFGVVLTSMLLGKAMGFYAFEGPLAAPALLAGYGDAWRVALRGFHIDLMVLGYTFLLWPSLVRPRIAAVAGVALAVGLLIPALGAWSRLAGIATVLWVVTFWRGRATA
jgi:hypothetical protein